MTKTEDTDYADYKVVGVIDSEDRDLRGWDVTFVHNERPTWPLSAFVPDFGISPDVNSTIRIYADNSMKTIGIDIDGEEVYYNGR